MPRNEQNGEINYAFFNFIQLYMKQRVSLEAINFSSDALLSVPVKLKLLLCNNFLGNFLHFFFIIALVITSQSFISQKWAVKLISWHVTISKSENLFTPNWHSKLHTLNFWLKKQQKLVHINLIYSSLIAHLSKTGFFLFHRQLYSMGKFPVDT